jgi:hypothetical protein
MPGDRIAVTGRTLADRRRLCIGCNGRLMIGDPQTDAGWPARLHLSGAQVKDLLAAAAEYRELSSAAGEYESAIDFVDWMSVDALREGNGSAVNTQRDAA